MMHLTTNGILFLKKITIPICATILNLDVKFESKKIKNEHSSGHLEIFLPAHSELSVK